MDELRVYTINFTTNALDLVDSDNFSPALVNSVDWSPDGNYLAVGSTILNGVDTRIYSWNGSTLTLVETFAYGSSVGSVDWSPDGKFLAIGGVSGGGETVRVLSFDGSTLTQVATGAHGASIRSVQWSPNGQYLALGGVTGTGSIEIRVFEFNGSSLTEIGTFNHGVFVNSVAWYPDGKHLAFASDLKGFGDGDEAAVLRFSPSASPVLSKIFGFDHGITLTSVDVRQTHTNDVNFAITDCHKLLVNNICPVDANCKESPAGIVSFCDKVNIPTLLTRKISCECENQILVSGDSSFVDDKEIRVIDGKEGDFLKTGQNNGANTVSRWSPSGKFVAAGGFGNILRVYRNNIDSTVLEEIGSVNLANNITTISWSADENFFVVGMCDAPPPDVRLFSFDPDAATPLVQVATFTQDDIRSVDWASDGIHIAIGGRLDGGVNFRVLSFDGFSLTEVDTGAYFGAESGLVQDVAWSNDSKFLAVGGEATGTAMDVEVYSFDGTSLTLFASIPFSSGAIDNRINGLSFSPDDAFLAAVGNGNDSAGDNFFVYTFKPNDSVILEEVDSFLHGGGMDSLIDVAWYPDGTRLVVGGDQVLGISIRGFTFDVGGSPPLQQVFFKDHGADVNTVDVVNVQLGDLEIDGTCCIKSDLKIDPEKKILANTINPVKIDPDTGECVEDENGLTCFGNKVKIPTLLTNKISCQCEDQVLIGARSSTDDGKELRVLDGADGDFIKTGESGTSDVVQLVGLTRGNLLRQSTKMVLYGFFETP